MPTLRAGATVTLVSRTVTGRDAYNNDVYTSTTNDIDGCAVSPESGTYDQEGTEQVSQNLTVHMPPGTVVQETDQVVWNGQTWDVTLIPRNWNSPFTGTVSMVEVQCRLVKGGGEAH